MSNEAIQQLANMIAEQIQGGNAPGANRNYSQEAVNGVVQTLTDKGFDKDSIEAAKVFMGGSQRIVEKTVEAALNKREAEQATKSLIRDAESTIKSVLKEHYADTEYGAQLKKMEKSIRVDAINKFTADQALMQRFNNGELPEAELEKIIDDTVDEYLKDVLGKDRKSSNTAIKSKPTSSEGAVAGDDKKAPEKGFSGDFDKDLASLSSEQRQMYDAKLIRLTQRLGRDPEKAKKEALESAKEMPAYFPTRGLTANI